MLPKIFNISNFWLKKKRENPAKNKPEQTKTNHRLYSIPKKTVNRILVSLPFLRGHKLKRIENQLIGQIKLCRDKGSGNKIYISFFIYFYSGKIRKWYKLWWIFQQTYDSCEKLPKWCKLNFPSSYCNIFKIFMKNSQQFLIFGQIRLPDGKSNTWHNQVKQDIHLWSSTIYDHPSINKKINY